MNPLPIIRRPRQPWRCPHTDRPYRALGLCNACYLKQNGGSRRWYAKHRKKMIKNVAQWASNNPLRRRRNARNWAHRNYLKDPTLVILRARVRLALKHNKKSASITRLLGCSIAKLRTHLESQFLPGMTWENHTLQGWHIDHRAPCAAFDLRQPEQQRACFHYTNLQPLWAFDNLSKGSRR